MKNISITEKLIFFFVSLGIVVIIIIGTYSYYFTKKALLNRTFDQLTSLRIEKKYRVEQFFLDRLRDIDLISKSEEIKKILDVIVHDEKATGEISEMPLNSYLNKYISSYGYYQDLYIVDRNTNCIEIVQQNDTSNSNFSGKENDQDLLDFCKKIEAAGEPVIQDLTNSRMFIYLGTFVLNEKMDTMGYVVLEIPISAINKIMFGLSENNGLGKSGETYLVGNDSLMRTNSRFKENAVLNIKVSSAAVKNAFAGKTSCEIVQDYRNISCLSSYSDVNIKGLNWVILAEIDEREAMIPVYSIRNNILWISIIIAASVFIFAFLISRKISLPIKRLQKASEQISEGNYEVKLAVSSLDEIGILTDSFNKMSFQLKKQTEEIEEEKRKSVSSLIDGQEMERQRLSRDLHDSLGQSMLAVKMKLEQTKNADIEKNKEIIDQTRELLKDTIQEIRNITNDLMPPVLEAFGLEQGLKNLCKETMANTGIQIEFVSNNIPDSLNKKLQIYLYRISQESINNITKHSGADYASVKIHEQGNQIFLDIFDNGKGFNPEYTGKNCNGIMNIKQRVELLSGECRMTSVPESGTTINIKIPVI